MSIKELREQKGWSQEHLAELANLSTRTIQRVEKDLTGSKESLSAIANAFELEYEEFKNILENKTSKEESNLENKNFFEFLKDDKTVIRFIFINILLLFINLYTNTNHLWFLYPLFGWGIPLFYNKYISYKKKD